MRVEPPGELAVAAQDAPRAIGHGPAVAAADEAAGAEIGIGDEIGRPLGMADDFVEEFYGGRQPARPVSRLFSLSKHAATMNTPDAQRPPPELLRPAIASRRSDLLGRITVILVALLETSACRACDLVRLSPSPGPTSCSTRARCCAEPRRRPLRARRAAGLPCRAPGYARPRHHHRRRRAAQHRRVRAADDRARRSWRWAILHLRRRGQRRRDLARRRCSA